MQVVKDPLKTKGARLSMELTIAGRYMVYAPTGEGVGVSRRLEDRERERLRRQTAKLELGGGGVIVRTAAHGAKREDFERELKYLHKLHEVLVKRVEETAAPDLVFQEADLSVRVVRDIFSAHFERAIVDDEQQYHRLVSFFTRTAPELVERVELWEQDRSRCSRPTASTRRSKGVLSRRVDLPSGGYLIIDYAEALTVIDVNSGSFIGRGKGAGARGHDHQDQPRGRRGGRQPAAAARHRRDHRHRLHRHGPRAQPRRGHEDAAQDARRGPHEDVHRRDLKARAGRDDPPERDRGRARDHEPPVPDVRGRGRDPLGGDDRDRVRAQAARRRRRASRGGGVPGADQPARQHPVHRPRLARAARAGGPDRQVVPVRGLRRARARPLRDHLHGHARGGRGARAAVPPGRRGAGRDRRAAHVRRRRRGRENRRLHHLDRRRRRRTSARSGWCASTRSGAPPRARCCWTSPARSSRPAPRAPAPTQAPRRANATPRPSRRSRRRHALDRRPSEDAEAPPSRRSPTSRPTATSPTGRRAARAVAGADAAGQTARAARMAYNRSLGVVAAEAGGAVRLPRPRPSASRDGTESQRKASAE